VRDILFGRGEKEGHFKRFPMFLLLVSIRVGWLKLVA
jgi:hypothetical protein